MNSIIILINNYFSPSLRYELNQKRYLALYFLKGLFFWKWRSIRFQMGEASATVIHYFGDPAHKPILMALFGVKPDSQNTHQESNKSGIDTNREIFVSQFPMRDMICVPFSLTTIVKLNRPVDAILATYASSLRRQLNKLRPQFYYEKVESLEKVEMLQAQMLKPYATARHDLSAFQLTDAEVKKIYKPENGRLDILYQNDEAVGCHLGNHYQRNGQRYWHVNRLGYPESVFSDYKRWGEVNALNLQLALETAIDEGYDFIDYGMSLAKPGAGLIEWKRRRKGFLSASTNYDYFYLKFPKFGAAQFFWDTPLFGVENGQVTLHLGVPQGKTDEEVQAHYHQMGYGGLYKVYLHFVPTQTMPALSDALLESMRELYADQETQPLIISYQVK